MKVKQKALKSTAKTVTSAIAFEFFGSGIEQAKLFQNMLANPTGFAKDICDAKFISFGSFLTYLLLEMQGENPQQAHDKLCDFLNGFEYFADDNMESEELKVFAVLGSIEEVMGNMLEAQ